MTNAEFDREFQQRYDSASVGAPDLNSYEKSYYLTQAVRDIIDEMYRTYEYSEYSKRGLGPLVKELPNQPIVQETSYFSGINQYETSLPVDLYYILQENIKTSDGCDAVPVEVNPADIDNINKLLKNPFKKPNKRKIIRTILEGSKVRLYSSSLLSEYRLKYIKKYTPIILSNFTSDSELTGQETIDGENTISETELPVFLHHQIVERAVILATRSLRENSLQTQIEV